ncbi:LysE family translocator [Uliginosibacterium gangwonense]|uniref:LysE family translocator n=1 Tax=Uliginosibacterium gangwonense TaxID=392736 RepID=UPI00039A5610|nr:LysE family transporter [Uliginosibacterium gangwonense]
MPWQTLLLVLSIHAVALVSPGPDFAIVTRLSIVSGRRTGLWAAAGVASAIGVYVLVCALGLSLVLNSLPMLSRILSIVGALYLGWLGVQCLRSTGQMPTAQREAQGGKAFVTGFFTNLLNPKAMLYFGSILSQALSPNLGWQDIALLFCLMVAESFLWFALVASLFSAQRVLDWLKGRLKWFDRVVGVVLLGLAAKVASVAAR